MSEFDLPNGVHPDGRKAWLRWALICDDVRIEEGGKSLIIGAYRNSIILHSNPSMITLRLAGAFEFVTPGEHVLEFRVTTPGGQGLGSIKSLPNADSGTYADFNVPVIDYWTSEGSILFDWRVDGGEWGPPMKWDVEFAADAKILPESQVETMAKFWDENITRGAVT